MRLLPLLAAAASCIHTASAHYRWTSLVINGQRSRDYQYVRQNTNYNSPVTSVSSNDIRCNAGGLNSGGATEVANVQAGSTITFALDQAIYHIGPILVYMSRAPGDVKSYDGSGQWFKIAQQGPTFSNGQVNWPTQVASYSFRIPSSISSGQYLLRVEQIGLHAATGANGAQFYISCAQVNVQGGGGANPGGVSFPGAYKATDPGILFNPYYPVPTSYAMPGPSVFNG